MDGQISMFDLDLVSGRTCPALSPAGETPKQEKSGQAKTSGSSSSRFSKLKNHTFMLLDLRPGAGNMLGPCWEYDPVWLGSLGTLNTSECPSDVVVSFLWQILQAIVPSRYCLSNKACRGILRRSKERGKPLPEDLERVLRIQSKLILPDGVGAKPGSHHINQRNEGLDTRHNPEFTLMELYQAYTDYNGMMDLTENLYRHVAQEVLGTTRIVYNGVEMDLGKPFERITMVDAVKKYAGVDWNEVETLEQARELAKEHNIEFEERHKKGDILNLFFEEYVEEHLVQPTFVMDHPIEISPLTKKKPENPDYVERFEFFMNGWEMANAYSELNDPIDQRERFKAQEELLAQGDEEANTTDEDFLNALEIGMPPTGGIGFGIDRMCMLLTNSAAIRDVLLFPTMKSIGGAEGKKTDKKEESEPAVKIDLSKVKVEPLFEDTVDFDTFSKSDFRVVKVEACEAVPKSKKLLKFTLNDGTDRKRTILSGIHEYYEPEELVGKTCVAITNLPPRKMMGIDSEGMLISAVYEYDGHEGLNLLMLDDSIPAGAKLY